MSVLFYIKSNVFSFRVTVHPLFSFLLQKTLKSVFLTPYDSLQLNHGTNLTMASEDRLMSVQFYIKSKVFSIRVTVNLLFWFYCKRRLNLYF